MLPPLSDYCYVDDEETQEFPVFVGHLAGPRNVSVDLKYDVLCL